MHWSLDLTLHPRTTRIGVWTSKTRTSVVHWTSGFQNFFLTLNLSHSTWPKGMSNTMFKTLDTCTTIVYQVFYFWWKWHNVATAHFLSCQSCIWHRWLALSNASLRWKCGDSRLSIQARFVAKKQETKCYLNWTCLYYQCNTLSKRCYGRTNTVFSFT